MICPPYTPYAHNPNPVRSTHIDSSCRSDYWATPGECPCHNYMPASTLWPEGVERAGWLDLGPLYSLRAWIQQPYTEGLEGLMWRAQPQLLPSESYHRGSCGHLAFVVAWDLAGRDHWHSCFDPWWRSAAVAVLAACRTSSSLPFGWTSLLQGESIQFICIPETGRIKATVSLWWFHQSWNGQGMLFFGVGGGTFVSDHAPTFME